MAGSPIAADDGYAIGVLCNSAIGGGEEHVSTGANPALTDQLPEWVLRALGADTRRLADEHDLEVEPTVTQTVSPILDDSVEAGIAELKRQIALLQDRPAAKRAAR
jgi:hypothetical protein